MASRGQHRSSMAGEAQQAFLGVRETVGVGHGWRAQTATGTPRSNLQTHDAWRRTVATATAAAVAEATSTAERGRPRRRHFFSISQWRFAASTHRPKSRPSRNRARERGPQPGARARPGYQNETRPTPQQHHANQLYRHRQRGSTKGHCPQRTSPSPPCAPPRTPAPCPALLQRFINHRPFFLSILRVPCASHIPSQPSALPVSCRSTRTCIHVYGVSAYYAIWAPAGYARALLPPAVPLCFAFVPPDLPQPTPTAPRLVSQSVPNTSANRELPRTSRELK